VIALQNNINEKRFLGKEVAFLLVEDK